MLANNASGNMVKRTSPMVSNVVKLKGVSFVDATCLECFTTGSIPSFSSPDLRRSFFILSFFRVISSHL
jgi:hypothetical protein